MKVFVCTDHATFWPVGGCSIVVADTEDQARELLKAALDERGLRPKLFTLREIDQTAPRATILLDGEY